MDRLNKDCPPDSFKKLVEYAKKHSMALISGTIGGLTKLVQSAVMLYWNI